MRREFPAAYYGKPLEPEGKDQYQLIGHTPGFPREAIREFERLATSIQWSGGGGDEPYSDCFALWPVGEAGAIVARLRDVGRDQLRRPHTLRLEGAWIARQEFGEWPGAICRLLQPSSWPEPGSAGSCDPLVLFLDTPDSRLGEAVEQSLAHESPPPTILVATHCNYRASGFAIVHDPGQPSGARQTISKREPRTIMEPPSGWRRLKAPSTTLRIRGGLLIPLLLGGLFLAVLVAGEHYLRRNLQQEVDQSRSALKSMEGSLEDATVLVEKMQRELRTAIEERDGIREDLRDVQRELDLYESILREHDIAGKGQLQARLDALDREANEQRELEQEEDEMRDEQRTDRPDEDHGQVREWLDRLR